MTDPAEVITEAAPKKRRKRRAAPRRKADVIPFKDEFAGLTKVECCTACVPDRCVISGINYCMHPMKSGDGNVRDPAAIARYNRAKKRLAHQKLEDMDFV